MEKIKQYISLASESFGDAFKEMLRLVVLAIIPIIITGINIDTGTFEVRWSIVFTMAVLTALRFIDKWLHNIGALWQEKTNEVSLLTKGLTRF